MLNALLRHRRRILVLVHVALIPAGYFAAFGLRFDLPIPPAYQAVFWSTLWVLLPARLLSFAVFRLYQGWWRHVGMRDLQALVKAATLSSAILLAALFLMQRLDGFPRSVIIIDWLLTIFLFGGIRFLVRSVREGHSLWRGSNTGTRTLLIGAGDAAERLLRQFLHNGTSGIRPVGLVDDDPAKQGMWLHGLRILGTTRDLPQLVRAHGVELLVIAIPSASRDDMQRIIGYCMEAKVEFKIVPSLQELLDGRARMTQLRRVDIEDLLGRDTVELDVSGLRECIRQRTVMVTGGAGSIGSELGRQIAALGPDRLILLEQSESPLYYTHMDIAKANPDLEIVPVIADVTDATRLEQVFSRYTPEYVFHAAAYKHVPLMEANVAEAVRNNVLGTLLLAQAAARHGAEKFVLISTDKAVHPSSVMGATKRIAERVVLGWPSLRASRTDFRAVRFGNVLGSQGSVVPLFRRQLASGGPLVVTHPDVTRYFMTIPEAAQLVLQAAVLPEAARRISMLEMGEPVRIVDLAENLLRLSGLEPYKDVPIVFSGLRPGEKLHEELMSEVEETVPTSVEKIRVVQTDETDEALLTSGLDRLGAAIELGDPDDLLLAICALVPECVSPLRESAVASARRAGSRRTEREPTRKAG